MPSEPGRPSWELEPHPLPQRIAVAGGHESWRDTREIEQQLIAMMMDPQFPGVYIVQSICMALGLVEERHDDGKRREPEKHGNHDLCKAHDQNVDRYQYGEHYVGYGPQNAARDRAHATQNAVGSITHLNREEVHGCIGIVTPGIRREVTARIQRTYLRMQIGWA
nr:hypothetical protein [Paracoccus mutanolyticus]